MRFRFVAYADKDCPEPHVGFATFKLAHAFRAQFGWEIYDTDDKVWLK